MIRALLLLAVLLLSGSGGAWAQGFQQVNVCIPTSSNNCPNVTGSNPFPVAIVSGGGTGGTASSFGATFPATGTAIGVKNGLNMVNLAADASNNLLVNCASGCAGGTFSNSTDAVATSATNGQTAAWLYAFNGTTWDRLRDDASKNLMVNVNAALPAGANTIGGVTQVSGPWTMNLTQVAGGAVAQGHGVAATAIRVELPTDGTGIVGLATGANTIGTVKNVGNAGGIFDFAGQNAAQPANSILTGCEFNTTPTTILTGNASPVQCDNAGNTLVNLKTALPAGANTIGAVNQAGTWNVGLSTGSNIVGKVDILGNAGASVDFAGQNAASVNSVQVGCQFNTSPTVITSGNVSPIQCDNSGHTLVTVGTALPAGGNTIGAVTQASGPWTMNLTQVAGAAISQGHGTAATAIRVELPTDGTGVVGLNAGTNTVGNVGLAPQTSGGLSMSRTVVANNTTAIIVKASAGQVFGVHGYSISASTPIFLKFYNATAQTCGTGSPVWEEVVPASGGTAGSGMVAHDANGLAFGTGIAMCITAGIADNDTTAPAASTYIVDVAFR